ncbi:choice-of-anchor P family protein [Kribbella sp. NPDC004536]|uniref:choice-of-anchor P family protein n=1 Tax=Kribbella sp. NPDC004536 TaxID=3364106 RepID=UPI0036BB6EDA
MGTVVLRHARLMILVLMITGLLGLRPAEAAVRAATVDPDGLADALLGGYMVVTDKEEPKHLVTSAEALDWRAAHPAATADEISAHLAATETVIDTKVADYLWTRNAAEAVGAAIEAIRKAPGAEPAGPNVAKLIYSIVGTNNPSQSGKAPDRISGAQQQIAWNAEYSTAQTSVWAAVAQTARADAAFNSGWNATLGSPLHVSAAASGVTLAGTDQLKNTLDFPKILDQQGHPDQYKLATTEQFRILTDKLYEARKQDLGTLEEAVKDRPAGTSMPEPTPEQRAEAKKGAEEREARINDAKAGLTGLAFLAGVVDQDLAREIKLFGDGAIQIAQAVDKVITSAQLVNTAFSLAAVGLTGNFIGAISTLVTLFAGAGSDVNKKILDAITALKQQIADLQVHLDKQFDRIDRKLNGLYLAMMGQFARINDNVKDVQEQAGSISTNLANVENQLQVLGVSLMRAIQALAEGKLWETTDALIDYSYYRPGSSLTKDQYLQGETAFYTAGTTTAASDTFVVPEDAYSDVNAKVGEVLDQYGPYGSISFLGAYAKKNLDPGFQEQGRVGNSSVWEMAANGYSLLSSQNPALAKGVLPARAGFVITAGRDIRDYAQAFSAPGPDGTTNPLFGRLLGNYTAQTVNLANAIQNREWKVRDGKEYGLFDGPEQSVPTDGLVSPQNTPKCGGGANLLTPENVSGKDLAAAEQFARYAHPQGPKYDVCWSADWINKDERSHITGPFLITVRSADLQVKFTESLTWPGSPIKVARTTTKVVEDHVDYQTCKQYWQQGPQECGPVLEPTQPLLDNWEKGDRTTFQKDAAVDVPADAEADAVARMTEFLKGKRIQHYQEAADALRTDPAASADLNLTVKLLRAYTQLGFPRALETDDTLRALLFGDHSIYTDNADEGFTVAALLDAAASNLAAGKPPEQQDQLEGTDACQRLPGLQGKDPFAACLSWSAAVRLNRLAGVYAAHFKSRWQGVDETLPLVQTAMRNLRLVTDTVNPGSAPGAPADDLPVSSPALATWSPATPSATTPALDDTPAVVTFKGVQFALWRGKDDGLYLSSTADGVSWSDAVQVLSGRTTTGRPALAVQGDTLVASWTEGGGVFTATSPDGVSWSAPAQVTNQSAKLAAAGAAGPALSTLGSKVFVAWAGGSGVSIASSTDGRTWSAPVAAGDAHTGVSPALATYAGRLVLVWQEAGVLKSASSPDGGKWVPGATIGGSNGPATLTAGDELYVAWKGADGFRVSATPDGSTWTPAVGADGSGDTAPAINAFNGRLWLNWAGGADRLWSSYASRIQLPRIATSIAFDGRPRITNGAAAELRAKLAETSVGALARRSVALTLGTGANEQTCYATTDFTGRAHCTIDKVDQPLNGQGTVPVAASYSGDRGHDRAVARDTAQLEYVTGRAFGLSATVNLALVKLDLPPAPDTGEVRTTGAGVTAPACTATVSAIVITASALCAKVTTATGPSTATAVSTADSVRIGIPGLDVIEVSGLIATSTSTCSTATGTTALTLKVAGKPVAVTGAPNSGIDLGGTARLVINEQLPVQGADHGLTVNAVHLTALGGTVDVIVGSTTSAAHNCG